MIQILIVIIVLGLLVYLLEQLPLAPPFKLVGRVVAILLLIVYLIRAFGIALP